MKKYLRWIVGAVPLLAGLFQIIDYIPTLAAYFATNNSFNVYYRGTLVDNGGGRTVMICIDDTTRLHNLKILFPTFKNTTKHTANDLSLTYSLEMTNIGLEPKDLFSLMYDGDNNYTLNPNRSLGPISSGDVKVFSCSPESKECLPLIYGSHKT